MSGRKSGRPAIVIGLVMMILGVIIGLAFVVVVGNKLGPAFENAYLRAPLVAPGQQSLTLTPGSWSVYAIDAATLSQGGGGTTSASFESRATVVQAALSTFDVTVTGPDGRQLVLRGADPSTTDTITRNQIDYTAELTFDVTRSGQYRIVVANNDGSQVIVAPTLEHVGEFIPWGGIVGIGAGGMTVVVGLIALIVGLVAASRRQSAGTPMVIPVDPTPPTPQWTSPLPPAGWYPDPMRSANWRYWDGQGWTAHTG